MAAVPYAEWLARGRGHQRKGRAVDAMLCFQQAIRAAPQAVDAHFHLGEVLWQIGRVKDAIDTWRQASGIAPDKLILLLPLAESLLAIGEAPAARDVAARALAIVPDHAHATALHAIARLTLGEGSNGDGPIQAIARVLERQPRLLSIPTVAGPLALALDATPAVPDREALLARIARLPAVLANAPALLLALAIEHAATADADDPEELRRALLATAIERGYGRDEHDALRRIALVATTLHADVAADLRAHYAQLCAYACAGPFPLAWPRRCAGDRLRVVAIVGPLADERAAAAIAALAAVAVDACDVTLAWFDAGASVPPGISDKARSLRTMVVPRLPDSAAARQIVALDADILVDLAGVAATTGPLLASHPARSVVTLAGLSAPNGEPLVDHTLPADTDLATFLRTSCEALGAAPGAGLDAPAMGAAWELAVRAHQQGDHASAHTEYGRVLEMQPDYAPAHYLLGVVDRQLGDVTAASGEFAAALINAPRYVDARVAAAKLSLDAGDADAAAALCAEGLALDPQQADLIRTFGLVHLARRDGAAAADLFARALAIEPTDSDTHYNHGVALQMKHDPAAAARAYQRALAFQPELTAADFNLGVIFQEQGNTAAAIAAYGNVLRRDPKRVAAYKNLGEVLVTAGRLDEWFANFRRFEANCPEALALAVQALEVLQHQGDFARLELYLDGLRLERYRAGDEIELCDDLEQLLYLLLFFDVEPAVVFRFAQTYDATARRIYGTPLTPPAVRRPGRIRVGYLSADLRNHVMGKMAWQALEHHDRSRFALHFYSPSQERDDWTGRFAQIAERFEVVATLSEREAALRIAADDLDILVDLSTHTDGAKPGILALKPARVQLTHVASAGTVGLSTIDFKLTDNFADVAENQAEQIETLLPMAGCVYPFRRVAPAVTHPFHRAALGIAVDAVLIGAFVTPMKLSRRCLGLWREVLDRVPRARLVFSPTRPAFRASYLHLAAAAGIAADRLFFLPQGRDDAENQARYELIDFVLDPLPYGGVNGTLEALDMGVPVVTLVGKRHGERTSLSILTNLGVSQTVAQGGREYVDIAVRLASDPAFMCEVRAAVRRGLAGSALTDAVGHTRNLEAAYCAALRQKAPEALRDAQWSAP
jgi:predicted O-linked N-acetylglucosamine transferase (SPINDLY family)